VGDASYSPAAQSLAFSAPAPAFNRPPPTSSSSHQPPFYQHQAQALPPRPAPPTHTYPQTQAHTAPYVPNAQYFPQQGTNPLAQSAPPPVSRATKPTGASLPPGAAYAQPQQVQQYPPHASDSTSAATGYQQPPPPSHPAHISGAPLHHSGAAAEEVSQYDAHGTLVPQMPLTDWRNGVTLPPLPCIVSSVSDGEVTPLGLHAGQLMLELRTYPQIHDPSVPPDQVQTGELHVAGIQLFCGFVRAQAILAPYPRTYVIQIDTHYFYEIRLANSIPDHIVEDLEQALMICGIMQRITRGDKNVDLHSLEGATDMTIKVDESARRIERGGEVVGSGLATAGSLLGTGIRGGTRLAKDHTDKGTAVHISEEDRLKQQKSEEQTRKLLKGSRMVTGGIRKGAGFLGKGVAAGVHHGKKTEWYQDKYGKDDDKPESAKKHAAKSVGTSSINALGSVKSGFCQGAKVVATDTRDASVEWKEHKQGKEAAEFHKRTWNTAGRGALGAYHASSAISTGYINVGIYTAQGAAAYDPNKKDMLNGGIWYSGWLATKDAAMKPWASKYCVLRTYALAIYVDPVDTSPKRIIKLGDVKKVRKAKTTITKADNCIEIQTKSDLAYFALHLPDYRDRVPPSTLHFDPENEQSRAQECLTWINILRNLVLYQEKNYLV